MSNKYSEIIQEYIHDSLLEFIFPKCEEPLIYNDVDKLNLAMQVLNFVGILFQFIWVFGKENQKIYKNQEFNDLVQAFWNGDYYNSSTFSVQMIQYAKKSILTDFKSEIISESDIVETWAKYINEFHYNKYKEFADLNHDYLSDLEKLLQDLPILRNAMIKKNDEGSHYITIPLTKKIVVQMDVYPIIKNCDLKNHDYLFIYDCKKQNDHYILNYITIDGYLIHQEATSTLDDKKFYECWINIINDDLEKDVNYFRINKLLGNSYKIITNLASCLSELNRSDDRRIIIENDFFKKYKNELSEMGCSNKSPKDKYTALLLKKGASFVVETILSEQLAHYPDYLKYLCEDDEKYEGFEKFIRKHRDEQRSIISRYYQIDSEESTQNTLFNENKKMIICTAILMAAGDKSAQMPFYVDTIIDKSNLVKKLRFHSNKILKTVSAGAVLERTLRFLIVYYRVLIEYSHSFMFQANKYTDADNFMKSVEEDLVLMAKSTAKKIEHATLGVLLSEFVAICNILSCKKHDKTQVLKKNNYSYEVFNRFTERTELCDLDELKAHTIHLTNFINSIKHDHINKDINISSGEAIKFIDDVLDFLNFLRYNSCEDLEIASKQYITFDPIYPFVVSFEAVLKNKDGITMSEYLVHTDDDGIKNIRMISLFNFDSTELYYCLPNMKKVFGEWWIEPILIKCSLIDRVILDMEAKIEMRVSVEEI